MFGYVKAFKPEMKVCEYDTYKAIYCGLCKVMGDEYGLLSRFTLSYDFTFLAVLGISLAQDTPEVSMGRCVFNPAKKTPLCEENPHLIFSADMAILMLWYKLCDNLQDGGFWEKLGTRISMLHMKKLHKKSALRHPVIDSVMAECMREQQLLEQNNCDNLDEICHPSAHLLGTVAQELSQDEQQKRVLYRIGYLLGRYVYISDALDDLEQDEKSGSYNPLIIRATMPEFVGEDIIESTKGSLYMTIAELGSTYDLLETQHLSPVLDNIIYLGLRNTVEEIIVKKNAKILNEDGRHE